MGENTRKSPIEILSESTGEGELHEAVIKGSIGIVPLIGPLMNELLFEIPNRVQQKRIYETVEILKEKVSALENSQINEQYLQGEDFYDFNKDFWRNSMDIRETQLRKSLANIFVDSIVNKEHYETSNNRLFMDFLVNVSSIQLIVLRFIRDSKELLERIESYDKFYEKYNSYPNKIIVTKDVFKYYCTDLINKGLISTDGELKGFGVGDYILYDNSYVEPSVFTTELGKEFIKYVISGTLTDTKK
ncbi:hypothetical protein [Ulvibacterium sp.]|uniref:hypothetical protein n=1 Tax=Ulvibacterium sp. TaxID=2665914 RepID=UPI002618A40E|nr:hypothetical protein [Ulvibacterium sp.]